MPFRHAVKFGFLGIAVAISLVPLGSSASGSTIDKPGINRLAGANRSETAATISRAVFPSPSVVFLASGQNYPDALSGGSAAARVDAPVLLTKRSSLPAATKRELVRTSPATIFVLGGTNAISNSVASTAAAHGGNVVRLAGANRSETAVAISKRSWTTSDVVYVASGSGYADALSGGALAAKSDAPVLLSNPKTLPAIVANELKRLSPSKIVLLGGTSALTNNVEKTVKSAVPAASVSRLAGANRYGTSAAIAAKGWSTSTRAFYSTGSGFPDALAGVPAAAANDAPLLLTKKTCMPATIDTATKNLRPTIKVLLGGTSVLSNDSATKVCSSGTSLTAAINKLKVASENNSGYNRALFKHWVDANHDCQDTRAEVLVQESLVPASGCRIITGKWFSYYDHKTWTKASDVDIDHMVPLAEAWGSGARSWNADTRQSYANDLGDPRTLVAVTDNVNQSKGARDPSEWLPQYEKCRYVSEWTAVKLRWNLTTDTTEKRKLLSIANTCPGATLTWKRFR